MLLLLAVRRALAWEPEAWELETAVELVTQKLGFEQEGGGEEERVEEPVPSLSAKLPPQVSCTRFVPCPKVQLRPGWGPVLKHQTAKSGAFFIFNILGKNYCFI